MKLSGNGISPSLAPTPGFVLMDGFNDKQDGSVHNAKDMLFENMYPVTIEIVFLYVAERVK
ncbi:hypothetical protein FCM35_KLT03815 [Carex littledalei]|uniref:Uncharacterized protein n=1 Tax=Carex littledalei TaxID=544730 RepID=A0A833VA32_9POAL|nr:hypothetical protein FCM35_KLT03815 [Carex littledalei]